MGAIDDGAADAMSISADGYVAAPTRARTNRSVSVGRALHEWHLGPTKDHPVNRQVVWDMMDGIGATIMGRNMFGPIRGERGDRDWRGGGVRSRRTTAPCLS
jgi:dihydrofolate reductase